MTEAEVPAGELDAILARLTRACARRYGADARVENPELATLGGSNRTIVFDLVTGEERRRLVSRQETYTFDHSPFLEPHLQFELMRLAWRHELPVPEPVFEFEPGDELGRGCVIGFVAGETLPKRLLSDPAYAPAREAFIPQAAAFLARLHAIDPAEAALLEDVPDSVDALAAQRLHYEHYGEPHPALEFAFRWLAQHRPPAVRRCLVHGDFRNGNMLMGPEGLRAVLDWECAHLGDPLEDFGWLCARSWRFGNADKPVGGFGEREALYTAYEAAGGARVDREAARWWEIFALLKWALFNVMQVYGHRSGRRRSPAFAACGRNTSLIEYDLLMVIAGRLD